MKIRALLFACLFSELPAMAGEAYIPFVAPDRPSVVTGKATTPAVELFTRGAAPRRYAVWFTPAGEDGTKVREPVGSRWLGAGSLAEESCCTRASGLLVVTGAPQVAVGARLGLTYAGPPATSLLTRLPVVTVRDGLPRGSTGVLTGLRRDRYSRGVREGPVATASLGILNLERSPATCSVVIGFYEAGGFPDLVEFVVPPLSVAAFPDLFAWDIQQRGRPDPFEVRARATCDRIFYPFGINFVGALQVVAGSTQLAIHWLEFVAPGLPIPNP